MTDAVRRSIRAFVQSFLGVLIGSGILSTFVDSGAVNGDALKKVIVSAAAAGLVAVVALAQNLLEDHTSFPAVLKNTPSPGLNPVAEDPAGVPDIVIQSVAKQPAKKAAAKKSAPAKKTAK